MFHKFRHNGEHQIRLKRLNNKSRPRSTTLINIDETGNLSRTKKTDANYIMVAVKVNDRDAYADIARDYLQAHPDFKEELSYQKAYKDRSSIITQAAPYIDDIVFVTAYMPLYPKGPTGPKIHKALAEELDKDLHLDDGNRYFVMIDQNESIIKDNVVKGIFGPKSRQNVQCVVLPSSEFYELQTNDFIVGAIRKELNGFNSSEVLLTGKEPKGRMVRIR